MDAAAIIIMIVVLLILSGVTIFLVKDYLAYKDATNNALDDTSSRIKQEGDTRLSNLKYVVDKVNVVNTDIYNTYTASNTDINTRLAATSNMSTKTLGGINHFLQFSSNVTIGANYNVSLLDLPGYVAPDVRLMKHVTMVSGLTVRDVGFSNYDNVSFCSREDPNRCIKFPDESGNILLTSMRNGSRVIIDTNTDVNGSINFSNSSKASYGTISPSGSANTNMSITSSNIFLAPTNQMGVSPSVFTPNALLHVKSTNATGDVFRATPSTGTNEVFINNAGELNVSKLKLGDNTIEVDSSTRGLRITVPAGGIDVTATGSTTRFAGAQSVLVNNKAVTTVA
jgi:hypothetical protein